MRIFNLLTSDFMDLYNINNTNSTYTSYTSYTSYNYIESIGDDFAISSKGY